MSWEDTTRRNTGVWATHSVFSDTADAVHRLRPSELYQHLGTSRSTHHAPAVVEFVNMHEHTSQTATRVGIDEPLFFPNPQEVIIEQFEAFSVVERRLAFRNKDSVARRLKIMTPNSPFFEISAPHTKDGRMMQQSKIAAGMEVCYTIKFKPEQAADYATELACFTEREKFIVPVRAIGPKPRLNFPDEVDFGTAVVKGRRSKTLLVANNGNGEARFQIHSDTGAFICPAQEMYIPPAGCQTIELAFAPTQARFYEEELAVHIADLPTCYIRARGAGENVAVELNVHSLEIDPTFISLSSQRTFKIVNHSESPVQFSWCAFRNPAEDAAERVRLEANLTTLRMAEEEALQKQVAELYTLPNMEGVEHSLLVDRERTANVARANLQRKYDSLARAIHQDLLLFNDEAFQLQPLMGEIWPHSEMEVTVLFRPSTSTTYEVTPFLDVVGREERIPLPISAVAVGPHVELNFDVFELGDVLIYSVVKKQITIINRGDIPATWHLLSSSSPHSSFFTFETTEGLLAVGQSVVVNVEFCSTALGEFSEVIQFSLQGNENPLSCVVRGHVVAPALLFAREQIAFGVVSFEHLHIEKVSLANRSSIPVTYSLRIPQDGACMQQELTVTPRTGVLDPMSDVTIAVEFIPAALKSYNYSLVVDVEGIGEDMLSLPITAVCQPSALHLKAKELDLGACFIRYPYEVDAVVLNASSTLVAKFEVLPQPAHSKSSLSYSVEPMVGTVEPGQERTLKVRVLTEKLGVYKVPILLAVAGSQEPPLQFYVVCSAVGPRISADQTELRWGKITCLQNSELPLELSNPSLIPAPFKIFTRSALPKFRVDVREGVLLPNETVTVQVIANLDDTSVHKDELHIVVEEGENIIVPLTAKGDGTTITCREVVDTLDFGSQLTNVPFERKLTFENNGRRPQALKWETATPDSCCTIFPAEVVLHPRTAVAILFRVCCAAVGQLKETLSLHSRVGQERSFKNVLSLTVLADVMTPCLQTSVDSMQFVFAYSPSKEPCLQRQELCLTNTTAVPLTFLLRTELPFNLSSWESTLDPAQSYTLTVEFDPSYRDDRQSHVVEKALSIGYRGHSQKHELPLKARIDFPNLRFSSTTLNFGCILNDTGRSQTIQVVNCSTISAEFTWSFREASQQTARSTARTARASIAEVFDIRPIRSVLQPGEQEDVEFTFVGGMNMKHTAVAVCEVVGGPEYELKLSAETSDVGFSLDKNELDFGSVLLGEREDTEFFISNTGKVGFDFELELTNSPRFAVTTAVSGKVAPGVKHRFVARFQPFLPQLEHGQLIVKVAHFEPILITLRGEGIFLNMVVDLPREPFTNIDTPPELTLLPSHSARPLLTGNPRRATGRSNLSAEAVPESSKSVSARAKALPSQRVDAKRNDAQLLARRAEANRVLLCQILQQRASQPHRPDVLASDVEAAAQAVVDSAPRFDLSRIVAAKYSVDFGCVVLGTSKTRAFNVTNYSTLGFLSWTIDKRILAGTGFHIQPEKMSRVPVRSSVPVTVTFSANKKALVGQKEVMLPVAIKGGPTISLRFAAQVCIPEVALSEYELQFGDVHAGYCKVMYLEVRNRGLTVAEWSLRRTFNTPSRDEPAFVFSATSGSLKPDEASVISVTFTPTEQRQYSVIFDLKVQNSTRVRKLRVQAEGKTSNIVFSSPSIQLDPILPFAKPARASVFMKNLTATAVEVYSVEFDEQYRAEEEVLAVLDKLFDHTGTIKTLVRNPGEGLQSTLLAAHHRLQIEEIGELDDELEVPEVLQARARATRRTQGAATDLIVCGPPLAGTSTVARQLADMLGLPALQVDTVLHRVAKIDAPVAQRIRRATGGLTRREKQRLDAEILACETASEAEQRAATEEYDKKHKRKKDMPVPQDVLDTPATLKLREMLAVPSLSVDTVQEAIMFCLSHPEYDNGVVVDLQGSELISWRTSVDALAAAIPGARFVVLSMSEDDYGERMAGLWKSLQTDQLDDGSDHSENHEGEQHTQQNSHRPALVQQRTILESRLHRLWSEQNGILGRPSASEPSDNSRGEPTPNQLQGEDAAATAAAAVLEAAQYGDRDRLSYWDFQFLRDLIREHFPDFGHILDIEVAGNATQEAVLETVVSALQRHGLSVDRAQQQFLPEPTVWQLIRAPRKRQTRITSNGANFTLCAQSLSTTAERQYRWLLQPREEVEIVVEFAATECGEFSDALHFEVVGCPMEYTLECNAGCELPTIEAEPKHVFPRRRKRRDEASLLPPPHYSPSTHTFEFGPLLCSTESPDLQRLRAEGQEARSVRSPVAVTARTSKAFAAHQPLPFNCQVVRITNNGAFDCTVRLGWESSLNGTLGSGLQSDCFFVDTDMVELQRGESTTVRIWAFPFQERTYHDCLVACVSNNPAPVSFPVSCSGALPQLLLSGPWEEAIKERTEALVDIIDKKQRAAAEADLAALKANPALEFDRVLVQRVETRTIHLTNPGVVPIQWYLSYPPALDTLLSFPIASGVIAPGDTIHLALSFSANDEIKVSERVQIKYREVSDVESPTGDANDRDSSSSSFDDCSRMPQSVYESQREFLVNAEAYAVKTVRYRVEDDSGTAAGSHQAGSKDSAVDLDFGTVQVGSSQSKRLVIQNAGKFHVEFELQVLDARDDRTIEAQPSTGRIGPAEKAEITITWCSTAALTLVRSRCIRCSIIDPRLNEAVDQFPLYVNVRSAYSTFRVLPSRGIPFGAVHFADGAKQRTFEIRNEGEFDFVFVLSPSPVEGESAVDALDAAAKQALFAATPKALRKHIFGEVEGDGGDGISGSNIAAQQHKKISNNNGGSGGGKDKAKASTGKATSKAAAGQSYAPPCDELSLGRFSAWPRGGILRPGEAATVNVSYQPDGHEAHQSRMAIHVAGARPDDVLTVAALGYALTAESCIPRVVTDDFASIFEEQAVVQCAADTGQKSGDPAPSSLLPKFVCYSITERSLHFGALLCSQHAGTPAVRRERIKLTNPTKVSAKVECRVVPLSATATKQENAKPTKSGGMKGKQPSTKTSASSEASNSGSVFAVEPVTVEIPPQGCEFVTIYFAPSALQTYTAGFEAAVCNGATDMPSILSFTLIGVGTLPCVVVEAPVRDVSGQPVVAFTSVARNKILTKQLVLRNIGLVSATCLFRLTGSSCFKVDGVEGAVSLEPGEHHSLDVAFLPRREEKAGDFQAELLVTVMHNMYELHTVRLTGQSYEELIRLDGLPEREAACMRLDPAHDGTELLQFQNLHLPAPDAADVCHAESTESFTMTNVTESVLRFDWTNAQSSTAPAFKPSVGHLGPGQTCVVTATVAATAPTPIIAEVCRCEVVTIELDNDSAAQLNEMGFWDDSMRLLRAATPEEVAILEQQAPAAPAPAVNTVKGSATPGPAKEKGKTKQSKQKDANTRSVSAISRLELGPMSDTGEQLVYEAVAEPSYHVVHDDQRQTVQLLAVWAADIIKFDVDRQPICFAPTPMLQTMRYKFAFSNNSLVPLPLAWCFKALQQPMEGKLIFRDDSLSDASSAPPFTITPDQCTVEPNSSQSFEVTFAPQEVGTFLFTLEGRLGEDGTAVNPVTISVQGRSVRPICHFEVADSKDYLARRPQQLKNEYGALNAIETPGVKCIEVESRGIRIRNATKFFVVNTTNDNLDFHWVPMGDASGCWRCVNSSGTLFPGRRGEMVFEFVPEDLQVTEAFYLFKLPHLGLEQLFLFSGKAVEPQVHFDTSRVNFGASIVGSSSADVVHLVNHEHLPFHFAFDKAQLGQCIAANGRRMLMIEPATGTLPPGGRVPISVVYHPQEEGTMNCSIQCTITKKIAKLSLNIKGEGFAIHTRLTDATAPSLGTAQGPDDGVRSLHSTDFAPFPAVNELDFGMGQVRSQIHKLLMFHNLGKFGIEYAWEFSCPLIQLLEGALYGKLDSRAATEFKLCFSSSNPASLTAEPLRLLIAGRPMYQFMVRAAAVSPAVRMSFTRHDFGECFIPAVGGSSVPEEVILRCTNHDSSSSVTLDCQYQSTRVLAVDFHSALLQPEQTIEIPIRFVPRDPREYVAHIPFLINQAIPMSVIVSGTGVPARLELVNAAQKQVSFGPVRVNSVNSKEIKIINRSKKELPVQICFSADRVNTLFLDVSPKGLFTLRPRETKAVQVVFSPLRRVAEFEEPVLATYAGMTTQLFVIHGKAEGVEASLDTDCMNFGTVSEGSQRTKRLHLLNTGDLPITFLWRTDTFGRYFVVNPLRGTVLPHSEQAFDVTFQPTDVEGEVQQDNIILTLTEAPSLKLTCTVSVAGRIWPPELHALTYFDDATQGQSAPINPDADKVIEFNTKVRQTTTGQIPLTNPSDQTWVVSPVLNGVSWKIPPEVTVPPRGQSMLEVTYAPVDTTVEQPHEGSLFVSLPDGTAKLFKLRGTADSPDCSGRIETSFAAKSTQQVLLQLNNWLAVQQTFHTSVEYIARPSELSRVVVADSIQLSASGTQQVVLRLHAHQEGVIDAIVKFTNRQTGEYVFYNVHAEVTEPDVLDTLRLEATVRQVAAQLVIINNPLQSSAIAEFEGDWWACTNPFVRATVVQPLIGRNEGAVLVEYRPLIEHHGVQETEIVISHPVLGRYRYALQLSATEAAIAQVVRFDTMLGLSHTQSIGVRVFNSRATEFAVGLESQQAFTAQSIVQSPAVPGWDGAVIELPIEFEPAALGEHWTQLTLSSKEWGIYRFELLGVCRPPAPQGPLVLAPGTSTAITFKNIFGESQEFRSVTDDPAFTATPEKQTVAAKGDMIVTIQRSGSSADVVAGNLRIVADRKNAVWTYYLRGSSA